MSKYIDERPFEQIVRETVLDGKHEDYIDSIVSTVLNDEQTDWRTNSYKGDQTIYDFELFRLAHRRKELENQYEQIDKHYTAVLVKVSELDAELDESYQDEEEEEEEYYDDDDDDGGYYDKRAASLKIQSKSKSKSKDNTMKPAEIAAKKKRDELASRNFKSTLATLQEELRDIMKDLREIEEQEKMYTHYQEIAVKTLRTLRRIIKEYRINKDIEFVKKGAYFVKDYSDKLYARYSSSA